MLTHMLSVCLMSIKCILYLYIVQVLILNISERSMNRLISNRNKLRSTMELYELTPDDVAKMLMVSKNTVNQWRSISSRMMPNNMMGLLNYKIEEMRSDADTTDE